MDEAKTAELVRRVLFVTLWALAVYCGVVLLADFQAIRGHLGQLPARTVWLALSLATVSLLVRFLRWQLYLRALKIRVSLLDSALIFTSGLGMSVTPGKAGELLKSLMLRQVSTTPIARSAPIVLAERISDTFSLLLLGTLGLLGTSLGPPLVLLALLLIGAVSVLLSSRGAGQWAIEHVTRLRFLARQRVRLLSAHESLLSLSTPVRALPAHALGLLAWTLHGLCLWSVAHAYPSVTLDVGQAMLVNAAPLLAGALAMVPGGLGLTEASMAGAMVALGQGAVTAAVATAITLVVRAVTLWWAVALGLAALGFWHVRDMRSDVDRARE